MSKKLTKEDLQGDMFLTLSDQILDKVVEYQMVIAGVLVVILFGGLGYVGFEAYQNYNENKAAQALYPLNRQFNDKTHDLERRRLEAQKAPGDKKAAIVPAPIKVDYQAEFGGLAAELKKQIMAHPKSQAALSSAVDLAKLMLDQNQPKEAVELLKPLAASNSASTVMQALLKSQLGAAYSHAGQYQDAITQYDAVIHNKELAYMHPEAYIKQAICYEKLGQADKARDLFQKVSLDYPQSQAAQTARLYSRVVAGSEAK